MEKTSGAPSSPLYREGETEAGDLKRGVPPVLPLCLSAVGILATVGHYHWSNPSPKEALAPLSPDRKSVV